MSTSKSKPAAPAAKTDGRLEWRALLHWLLEDGLIDEGQVPFARHIGMKTEDIKVAKLRTQRVRIHRAQPMCTGCGCTCP